MRTFTLTLRNRPPQTTPGALTKVMGSTGPEGEDASKHLARCGAEFVSVAGERLRKHQGGADPDDENEVS